MAEPPPRYVVERSHATVVTVRMAEIDAAWEQWFLLRSDAHHDNAHSDHGLERKHLDEARARGAGILDIGDLFDVMNGRWDKRADTSQLRPELRGGNYLDAVLDYNAAFYTPYAARFVMLSPGNHEHEFYERHQTCLTTRLTERLNAAGGSALVGTYAGWVRFLFTYHSTSRQSIRLRYHHGAGGNSAVSLGVTQTLRDMSMLGNADLVISGHSHQQWAATRVREVLLDSGRPQLQEVEFLKCGGYKDEYSPGQGWAVRKGFTPAPLGAFWLRFFWDARTRRIGFETCRAK